MDGIFIVQGFRIAKAQQIHLANKSIVTKAIETFRLFFVCVQFFAYTYHVHALHKSLVPMEFREGIRSSEIGAIDVYELPCR